MIVVVLGYLHLYIFIVCSTSLGVVGCGEGVVYLRSPGRPTGIGLQLDKA